jgi:hypothetical protein
MLLEAVIALVADAPVAFHVCQVGPADQPRGDGCDDGDGHSHRQPDAVQRDGHRHDPNDVDRGGPGSAIQAADRADGQDDGGEGRNNDSRQQQVHRGVNADEHARYGDQAGREGFLIHGAPLRASRYSGRLPLNHF